MLTKGMASLTLGGMIMPVDSTLDAGERPEIDAATLQASNGLVDSSAYLGDVARIDEFYKREGYLYFRQVLPYAAVETARRRMATVLYDLGLVSTVEPDAEWIGGDRACPGEESPLLAGICPDLLADPGVAATISKLLREPLATVPMVLYRAYRPNYPVGSVHQDAFFDGGNIAVDGYRPLWIPLVEMDEAMGGVTLVPQMMDRGLLREVSPMIRMGGIRDGVLPHDGWLRADYAPGDLLVINPFTPHVGLPNRSNRVRLSIDTRLQRAANRNVIVGHMINVSETSITLGCDDQTIIELEIDEGTFIRMVYANPWTPHDIAEQLEPGTQVMAVRVGNRATLLRHPHFG
jgi:hypothetical protein